VNRQAHAHPHAHTLWALLRAYPLAIKSLIRRLKIHALSFITYYFLNYVLYTYKTIPTYLQEWMQIIQVNRISPSAIQC